jgi:DNA-binding NarL/FixJ family response regulator
VAGSPANPAITQRCNSFVGINLLLSYNMPVSVVIYEDNELLRRSIELLLKTNNEFTIAGSFADCNKVKQQMNELHPQLVIMDIDMPGMPGTEGVALIKEINPGILVVMHTVFEDDSKLFEALCAGANGYLLKKTSPEKFIEYLYEVLEGGAPMSPGIARKVMNVFSQKNKTTPQFNISLREIDLLNLLAKGYSYKQIAVSLAISINTVRKHCQNIYNKLHVNCGTEAVVKALKYRIMDL